ncbi:MAG: hypothetical protein DMG31_17020 [Acidobacteria bacterium]|nr:MAG: hypothetical protein DMG31_17020 [Acidobacteriota bacterium]
MAAAFLLLFPGALLRAQDDNSAFLPDQVRSASTVPANGDVNPYGVAFVPPAFPAGGTATPGNILISNFNNSQNLQGTGTTIVDIPPGGPVQPFFQGKAGLGLTTALNILQKGFVLVGNFPSPDGTCPNSTPGSILVIDKRGNLVSTISNSMINGPWDSALFDQGNSAKLFVANGLTGTVVRLELSVGGSGVKVKNTTQIASGYKHNCDPVTFVDAPTGLVYDAERDVLFVASTADNAVFAVGNAGGTTQDRGRGTPIYSDNVHLHGPLGMVQAPNGHLIVSSNDAVNSDPNQPSELVEFTKGGQFIKQISVDPLQGGSFGLAVATSGRTAQLAAVDDNQSILLIWTLPLP